MIFSVFLADIIFSLSFPSLDLSLSSILSSSSLSIHSMSLYFFVKTKKRKKSIHTEKGTEQNT